MRILEDNSAQSLSNSKCSINFICYCWYYYHGIFWYTVVAIFILKIYFPQQEPKTPSLAKPGPNIGSWTSSYSATWQDRTVRCALPPNEWQGSGLCAPSLCWPPVTCHLLLQVRGKTRSSQAFRCWWVVGKHMAPQLPYPADRHFWRD